MEKIQFSELGSFEKSPFITTNSSNGVRYFTNNSTNNMDYYKNINHLIKNSPTTASCIDVLSMLSYGRGINFDKIKENTKLYDFLTNDSFINLNDVLRRIILDYIKFNGFSLLVGSDRKGKITSLQYLKFDNVRVTKIDDFNQPIEYAYSNDWEQVRSLEVRKTITLEVYDENKTTENKLSIYVYRNINDYLGDIYPTPYWEACFDRSNFEYMIGYNENRICANGINGKIVVTRNYTESNPIQIGTVFNADTQQQEPVMKEQIDMEMEALMEAFTNIDGKADVIITKALMNDINSSTSVKPIDVMKTEGVDKDLIKNTKESAEKDICKVFGVPIDLVNPQSSTGLSSSSDYINELYNRLQNTKVNAIQQTILSKLQKLINNCNFSNKEELIIDLFVDTNKDKTKATSDTSTTTDVSNNNNDNNTGGL